MSKLVVYFAFVAICLAYPSPIASSPFVSYSAPLATVAYQQPALATVGAVVNTVPTDRVVQDVVTPVIRTTYTIPASYTSHTAAPVTYTSYAAGTCYV